MAGIEPVTHQFGVTNPLAWYRTRPGEIALSVFVFVGCVALWWGYIRYTSLSPLVLPTPYEVLLSLIDNTRSGYLLENCWVTLSEILLGFALGSALGIALGTVAAINPLIRNVLSPYIVASQAMPKLAMAPIMVIWLGFGIAPKVVVAALICFFPLFENTVVGLTSVDSEEAELFRSLSANAWQTFVKLRIPHALPIMFTGLRVAITLAVVGAVVGEYVGANRGLGALIIVAQGAFDTPLMFALFVYLTIIGIVLYKVMEYLERTFFAWRYIGREG